jgi:DNA-directed RNA polymerase specialized sigma24 family protein
VEKTRTFYTFGLPAVEDRGAEAALTSRRIRPRESAPSRPAGQTAAAASSPRRPYIVPVGLASVGTDQDDGDLIARSQQLERHRIAQFGPVNIEELSKISRHHANIASPLKGCYYCAMPDRKSEPPLISSASAGAFATTHWSVVLAAASGEDPANAAAALEQLCRAYWYPLYVYVRRRGYSAEDAQDGTQSFFARILEGNLLPRASSQRGRFRSFLLTALQNFLADQHDWATARKRGGGNQAISLDALQGEARYALEPVDVVTPDVLFERRWATTVLEGAWLLLETEYEAEGKLGLFRELRRFNSANESAPGYHEIGHKLGLPENTVKSLVHRMRRRYRTLLRAEIARTVEGPGEIEEEIRYLLRVLGT